MSPAAGLSEPEVAFLLGGRHLGRLATVDPRGRPHVVPTGWRYDPGTGTVEVTGRDLASTRKFRNVAAQGYAALVVDDVLPPWRPRCVLIRGRAQALAPPDGEERIRLFPDEVLSWGLDAVPELGSTDSVGPKIVIERYLDLVARQRWHELPDLYAEDAVVEHPMTPGAQPLRGRGALRAHFARLGALELRMRATDVVIHETSDPETVVAEFTYRGTAGRTGDPVERRCVFVTTVRDGLIVASRDHQADVSGP